MQLDRSRPPHAAQLLRRVRAHSPRWSRGARGSRQAGDGQPEPRPEAGYGEARVLSMLLETRFGVLPDDVRRRIESADAETLLLWSKRVLAAARIEDIFD